MNSREFKTAIERVIVSAGFERYGKLLRRHDSRVWTLIKTEKGFGHQWHINVGFWLESLGSECPKHVEQSHMYFRLERLFQNHQETIALAGSLGDIKQPVAFENLLSLLESELEEELHTLGTEGGLRGAMASGRLMQGMVRKEAREHLQTE